MYGGAGFMLFGAALFLAGYAGLFLLVTHLFVILYEEPADVR